MPLIVILDDRVTNRNIFSRLASSLDAAAVVRAFGDPVDALDWMEDNPPDLVVTDYKMPRMDGAQFTKQLRDRPASSDVPVVVITAYDDRAFRLRALEAGATDFLQSPVDHDEFLTRARNLLRLRQQQQSIKSRARALEERLEVSERTREALLRNSREALAQVIDTLPAMISATDRDGRCVLVNAYQAALLGASPAELVGREAAALFGPARAPQLRALDDLVFRSGVPLPGFEEQIIDRDGVRHVFLTSKVPLHDAENTVVSVLTTALDITDRKVAEDHLRHMAHHDSLTELPNRALLCRLLQQALDDSGGNPQAPGFALHFIDLDRFKSVNDALGHHVGDGLLRQVGARMRQIVGPQHHVARLGGDEFAILQLGVPDAEAAGTLANAVLQGLAQPFPCNGQDVTISASIGMTLYPADGGELGDLLRNADIAMHRAKDAGRNAWRLFVRDMNMHSRETIMLEADLRVALERNQFVLYYQPQVDLRSGEVVGAEALLRWRRPGRGLVSPGEFLAIAEATGLITSISTWVLNEACAQGVAWQQAGLPKLRMAVNLSPVQFGRQDVRQTVVDALTETGLDPHLLELELTEGALIQDAKGAAKILHDLRALGVSCAIDDFGIGYSSLSYVKNFPVHRLKIDRSFIRNLKTDPSDAAIVRAILDMGHSLGMEVMAEGVETEEQLAHLLAQGCEGMQGFYFSPPVSAEDFQALVRRGKMVPLLSQPC